MAEFRRRRGDGSDGPDGLSRDPFGTLSGRGRLAEYPPGLRGARGTDRRRRRAGLSFGVHVVLATPRWADIRPALKDQLGTRIELRLGDPTDSDIGRAKAMLVPAGRPGRGMTRDGLHLLAALPRLDGVARSEDLGVGVADAVARIEALHPGESAPPVRMLPERFRVPICCRRRPGAGPRRGRACPFRSASTRRNSLPYVSTSPSNHISWCSATARAARRRCCAESASD